MVLYMAPGALASRGVYDAFGQLGTLGGSFKAGNQSMGGVAVNTSGNGGANPGDVYIADRSQNRIERFTTGGAFIAAWGQDVIQSGAPGDTGTGYEICTVAANCKAGVAAGTGGGMNTPIGVAVNQQNGTVYVIDRSNQRVDAFTATGTFLRAFGQDVVASGPGQSNEEQTLTVDAASGQYKLSFYATSGRGFLTSGSPTVTFLTTTAGAFAVGQPIVGKGIPPATTILAVGATTLTLSANAVAPENSATGTQLAAGPVATTSDIEANESAVGVEAKLNALATVNAGGGNVTVSGGPGAPGGTSPYLISFGGARAATNVAALVVSSGTTPLTGGAANATIGTPQDGATGFEICEAPATCKAGAGGVTGGALGTEAVSVEGVAVAPTGAPNAGDILVANTGAGRVEEFTPSGAFARNFGWGVVANGPDDSVLNQFEICRPPFDICKGGASGAGTGQFAGLSRVAEDSSGNLYTVERTNFQVQRFVLTATTVTPQGNLNPGGSVTGTKAIGSTSDTPRDVAVDTATPSGTSGTVYVLKDFPAGTGAPTATLKEARILQIDPTANGGEGAVTDVHGARAEMGSRNEPTTALGLNPASGRLYVTQPVVAGAEINQVSPVYILDNVPPIVTENVEAVDIGSSTATLRAKITPAPLPSLHTLYRFEYAKAGAAVGSCGEGGAGWTRTPLQDADIGNGASPVTVEREISGLQFEAVYEFCLYAHTRFNGSEKTVAGPPFQTQPTPPIVRTGAAIWSSPVSTGPSLLLGGRINPGHARTTYFFQYVEESVYLADQAAGGDGFADAVSFPVHSAEAGEGVENVFVHQSVSGLDPNRSYRYRLIAANTVAAQAGATRSVVPPAAGDSFYELVSAGDGWGSGLETRVGSVAADGGRATFTAQAFGDPSSLPAPQNPFVSERTAHGWEPKSMLPRGDRAGVAALGGPDSGLTAAGLGATLWAESSRPERERGEVRFGIAHIDGTFSSASGLISPLNHPGIFSIYSIVGASPDLSSYVFKAGTPGVVYFPDETPVTAAGGSNLYGVSTVGGTPDFRLVNRADGANGAQLGGVCGAGLGGALANENGIESHALSDDGAVVYFTARPGEPTSGSCTKAQRKRIFKRVAGETTVEVSAARCTPTPACPGSPIGDDTYQGASADGRVAFFTTSRRLLNSDTDNTSDLYLYDSSPPAGQPQLVQVSAGEVAPGHPTVGAGAETLGMVDNAADGSRVYFVAKGVLCGENAEHTAAPKAGQPNLYVFERDGTHPGGRIAFLGTLDGTARSDSNGNGNADELIWENSGLHTAYALPIAGGKGNGRFLLFSSFAGLSAADEDSDPAKHEVKEFRRDLYRYDDQTGQMLCLSCAGNGPFDVNISPRSGGSQANYAERSAVASADVSTVAFATPEQLLSTDTNQGKNPDCNANSNDVFGCDVYVWREGSGLSLVSGGTEDLGIATPSRFPAAVSADGNSVFFITAAQLVAGDSNNANDLYVARVGGGFPAAASVSRCEGAEECQGPAAGGSEPQGPATSSFAGSGNEQPAKPCRRGTIRRKGKCVKKPHHKSRHRKSSHHKRRAAR